MKMLLGEPPLQHKYAISSNSSLLVPFNLVDELKTAINKLDIGDISDVVSTDYAYHIVVREKLDNEKLDEYLDTKREEKFIKNISNNLEKIVIINGDYLEEITVK